MLGPMPNASATLDIPVKLRPSERVARYLDREATRVQTQQPERLPTVKQLAKALDVSPRTVASVFRDYARQGKIQTRAGDGSYVVPGSDRDIWRVGLSTSRLVSPATEPTGSWSANICGGVLEAASGGGERRPVMVLPLGTEDSENDARQIIEQRDRMDGLILFPHTQHEAIREAYESLNKPVVELNPATPTQSRDFVAPDYFGASTKVGQAAVRSGRQRVLFLISGRLDRSVSTQLRLSGLTNGIGPALGDAVQVRVRSAEGPEAASGESAADAVLASGYEPDLIYCAGDDLARGAISSLQRRGVRVPEDCSVIGGTGTGYWSQSGPALTRCQQPLSDMGIALVDMLLRRLSAPEHAVPGRILPLPFALGQTTRTEENDCLA